MIKLFRRQEPIAFWQVRTGRDGYCQTLCLFDLPECGAVKCHRAEYDFLIDSPGRVVQSVWFDCSWNESIVCRTDVYPLNWLWPWIAVRLEETIRALLNIWGGK